VTLALLLLSFPARADLQRAADRVVELWGAAGQGRPERRSFFLEQGRGQQVRLPERPGRCLSVALVGPRSAEIFVHFPSDDAPEGTRLGLLFLSRCGPERATLERFAIEARGQRSAVELIAVRGDVPAPDPRLMLPERALLPGPPPVDPGRAPSSEGIEPRVLRAQQRSRREGAVEVLSSTTRAQTEGNGQLLLRLDAGCHRIELLADAARGGRVVDVDAELRDPRSGAVVVRDRSDTPDARIEHCNAEPATFALTFRGAPARGPVAVLQARWALPAALPSTWGPRARSSMALALRRRELPAPSSPPLRSFTGLAGSTLLPAELAPGACYLLLLGVARGDPRALSVSASLENLLLRDEGAQGKDGLALAFCSERSARASFVVEARGAGLAWGAALWRVGGAP
jgi:hypothetical protein